MRRERGIEREFSPVSYANTHTSLYYILLLNESSKANEGMKAEGGHCVPI